MVENKNKPSGARASTPGKTTATAKKTTPGTRTSTAGRSASARSQVGATAGRKPAGRTTLTKPAAVKPVTAKPTSAKTAVKKPAEAGPAATKPGATMTTAAKPKVAVPDAAPVVSKAAQIPKAKSSKQIARNKKAIEKLQKQKSVISKLKAERKRVVQSLVTSVSKKQSVKKSKTLAMLYLKLSKQIDAETGTYKKMRKKLGR